MSAVTLSEHILEMRALAKLLIPFTFPRVSYVVEMKVLPLKCRTIVVDGYEISINFSISDREDHEIEAVQIQSAYTPFLPFALICKIGREFLGSSHLAYVDFMKNSKKIYCWTLRTRHHEPIPPKKSIIGKYEGFEYNIINPGSANLYGS